MTFLQVPRQKRCVVGTGWEWTPLANLSRAFGALTGPWSSRPPQPTPSTGRIKLVHPRGKVADGLVTRRQSRYIKDPGVVGKPCRLCNGRENLSSSWKRHPRHRLDPPLTDAPSGSSPRSNANPGGILRERRSTALRHGYFSPGGMTLTLESNAAEPRAPALLASRQVVFSCTRQDHPTATSYLCRYDQTGIVRPEARPPIHKMS